MMESCENCGRNIGKLETPHLWNSRVVCAACSGLLGGSKSNALRTTSAGFAILVIGIGVGLVFRRPNATSTESSKVLAQTQPAAMAVLDARIVEKTDSLAKIHVAETPPDLISDSEAKVFILKGFPMAGMTLNQWTKLGDEKHQTFYVLVGSSPPLRTLKLGLLTEVMIGTPPNLPAKLRVDFQAVCRNGIIESWERVGPPKQLHSFNQEGIANYEELRHDLEQYRQLN